MNTSFKRYALFLSIAAGLSACTSPPGPPEPYGERVPVNRQRRPNSDLEQEIIDLKARLSQIRAEKAQQQKELNALRKMGEKVNCVVTPASAARNEHIKNPIRRSPRPNAPRKITEKANNATNQE